jgi:hypothetical protein
MLQEGKCTKVPNGFVMPVEKIFTVIASSQRSMPVYAILVTTHYVMVTVKLM